MSALLEQLWFAVRADGGFCLLALTTALLVAFAGAFPARALGRRAGMLDRPGGRHIHARPTATLGGIPILVAVVVGMCVALCCVDLPQLYDAAALRGLVPILAIGASVCALGAWDDVRKLSPGVKLAGLTLAGVLLVVSGVAIEYVEVPGIGSFRLGWLAAPATVFWVLACTNAVNLIDGVDGAGAGVVAVSAAVLALLAFGLGEVVSALLFSSVCGATVGFWIHNRQPARIFLGDSGSLLLGFLLAANAAAGCTKRATALSLAAALLALGVPFADTTQSILRRLRKARTHSGRRPVLRAIRATVAADTGHIHHRLVEHGMSHRRVSLVFCLVTSALGLCALLLLPSEQSNVLAIAGAVLAGGLMLLRLWSVREVDRQDAPPAEQEFTIPARPPRAPARRTPRTREPARRQ